MLGKYIGRIVGSAVTLQEKLFPTGKPKRKTPSWLRLPSFHDLNFILLHCMFILRG